MQGLRVRESIEAQVAELQRNPPEYLVSLKPLQVPRTALVQQEVIYPCPEGGKNGPWELNLVMRGPPGGNYANELPVRLEFNKDYPAAAPNVNFMCIIHHFFLNDDNNPFPLFFESLRGDHSVKNILKALYGFLTKPVHPCASCDAKFLQGGEMNAERVHIIESYKKQQKYPALFDAVTGWREEWFQPELFSALASKSEDALRALLKEEVPGVYSFPLFREGFCAMFLEEMDNFYASGLPVRRPNSMNNYGIIVNEIGMERMIDVLQQQVLQPISALLFGEEGAQLDRHHCFMVQYKPGEDLGLDMHTDDSDVTYNVCLGKEFEGAGLTFCGMMGAADHRQVSHVYKHVKGRCVVHLGRKRHGADDITSGERRNLIIWNTSLNWRRSKAYREVAFEKEASAPSLQCLSYTHDRDYGIYKEYPPGREGFQGHGWCPPSSAEYPGFKEEPWDATK